MDEALIRPHAGIERLKADLTALIGTLSRLDVARLRLQ